MYNVAFIDKDLQNDFGRIVLRDTISIVLDKVGDKKEERPYTLDIDDSSYFYESDYDRDTDLIDLIKALNGKPIIVKMGLAEPKGVDILVGEAFELLDSNPNLPPDEVSLYDRMREYLISRNLIRGEQYD